MVTTKQVCAEVREFLGAAKVLLDGGHPGQAAARAYYSVHFVAEHLARVYYRDMFLKNLDGSFRPKIYHSDCPNVVAAIRVFQSHPQRKTTVIPHSTLGDARSWTDALLKARMDADYRPFQSVSKDWAGKLIVYAGALTEMLMSEVEFAEAEEAAERGTPHP